MGSPETKVKMPQVRPTHCVPYWPKKSTEILENSPKILTNHQIVIFSFSLMSVACLVGPNLVHRIAQNVTLVEIEDGRSDGRASSARSVL